MTANRKRILCGVLLLSGAAGAAAWSRAAEASSPPPAKTTAAAEQCADCAKGAAAAAAQSPEFKKVAALSGTWIGEATGMGDKPAPASITFRPTAGGTAVLETLFPGTEHEMLDVYTATTDGKVLVTHYCASGQQPHLQLAPAAAGDGGAMRFEFVDGGNIKSKADPHMDSVELKLDGDKLTESWKSQKDATTTNRVVLELHRQPPASAAAPVAPAPFG